MILAEAIVSMANIFIPHSFESSDNHFCVSSLLSTAITAKKDIRFHVYELIFLAAITLELKKEKKNPEKISNCLKHRKFHGMENNYV